MTALTRSSSARRLRDTLVLTSAVVALSGLLGAPVAVAATSAPSAPSAMSAERYPCIDAVNARTGKHTARACVDRYAGDIDVYDLEPDGLHATGYWSTSSKSGSCDNYYGSKLDPDTKQPRVKSCDLPVKNGQEVCFRAAAKEHDDLSDLSTRRCTTIDFRVMLP